MDGNRNRTGGSVADWSRLASVVEVDAFGACRVNWTQLSSSTVRFSIKRLTMNPLVEAELGGNVVELEMACSDWVSSCWWSSRGSTGLLVGTVYDSSSGWVACSQYAEACE